MPFVCRLVICGPLWVSVNTFYGSTGTEALSSRSKWFYKQFTEAWCLLTWNPLPLSLTYYHWYNLFSGSCGTDQWFSWLILLPCLKRKKKSVLTLQSEWVTHVSVSFVHELHSKPLETGIRKSKSKLDNVFVWLVLAEQIWRGLRSFKRFV